MRNENNLAEPQRLDHRREIAKLLLETVGRARRLVGRAKAQEIERNYAPTGRRQVGNKVVVDAKIVGEAVHEHESRTRTVVIAGIEFSLFPRNTMLGESRLADHGALVERASDIRTAASRRRASVSQRAFDWIIATSSFLKN